MSHCPLLSIIQATENIVNAINDRFSRKTCYPEINIILASEYHNEVLRTKNKLDVSASKDLSRASPN